MWKVATTIFAFVAVFHVIIMPVISQDEMCDPVVAGLCGSLCNVTTNYTCIPGNTTSENLTECTCPCETLPGVISGNPNCSINEPCQAQCNQTSTNDLGYLCKDQGKDLVDVCACICPETRRQRYPQE